MRAQRRSSPPSGSPSSSQSPSPSPSYSSLPGLPCQSPGDGTRRWALSRLLYSLCEFLFSSLLLVGAALSCATSQIVTSLRLQSSCSCADCLDSRAASSYLTDGIRRPGSSIDTGDGWLDPGRSSSQPQEKGLADSRLDPELPNSPYASSFFHLEERNRSLLPVNVSGDDSELEYHHYHHHQHQHQHCHHPPHHYHPFSPSPSDHDDGSGSSNDGDGNSYVVCRICYEEFLEASYQQSHAAATAAPTRRRPNAMMMHGDVQEAVASEEEETLRRRKERKGRTVAFRDVLDSNTGRQQDVPRLAAFMAGSTDGKKNLRCRKVDCEEEEDASDLGSNASPQHLFMTGSIEEEGKKRPRQKEDREERALNARKRDIPDLSTGRQEVSCQSVAMAGSAEGRKRKLRQKEVQEERVLLGLGNPRKMEMPNASASRKEAPRQIFVEEEGKKLRQKEDREERVSVLGNLGKRGMPSLSMSRQEAALQQSFIARFMEEAKKLHQKEEEDEEESEESEEEEEEEDEDEDEEEGEEEEEEEEENTLDVKYFRKRDMPKSNTSRQEDRQQIFVVGSMEEENNLNQEEEDDEDEDEDEEEEEEEEEEERASNGRKLRKRDMPKSKAGRQEVPQQSFMFGSMESGKKFCQKEEKVERKKDMPKANVSKRELPQQIFTVGYMEEEEKLGQEEEEEEEEERTSNLRKRGKRDTLKSKASRQEAPQRSFVFGSMEKGKLLHRKEDEKERTLDLVSLGKLGKFNSSMSQLEVPPRTFMVGCMEVVTSVSEFAVEEESSSLDVFEAPSYPPWQVVSNRGVSVAHANNPDLSSESAGKNPSTGKAQDKKSLSDTEELIKRQERVPAMVNEITQTEELYFEFFEWKESRRRQKMSATFESDSKIWNEESASFNNRQEWGVPTGTVPIPSFAEATREIALEKMHNSAGDEVLSEILLESTPINISAREIVMQNSAGDTVSSQKLSEPIPIKISAGETMTQNSAGGTFTSQTLSEAVPIKISAREVMTPNSAGGMFSSQKLPEATPIKISAREFPSLNSAGGMLSSQKLLEATPIKISAREIPTLKSTGGMFSSQKLPEATPIKISAREIPILNSAGGRFSSQKLPEATPLKISAREITTQNSVGGTFSYQQLLEATLIKISAREIATQNSAGGAFLSQKLLEATPIKTPTREIMTQYSARGTVSSQKLPEVTPIKISAREIKIQNPAGEGFSSQKLPEASQWKKSSREIGSLSLANTGFRIPSHLQDNPRGFANADSKSKGGLRSSIILPLRASRSSGCLEEEAIKAGAKQAFAGFSDEPLWKSNRNNHFKSILPELSQERKQIFHAADQNYGGSPKTQPRVQFSREQEEITDGDQEGSGDGNLQGTPDGFQGLAEELWESQEDARAREEELAATRELLARSYAKFPGKLPENLGRLVKVRSLPVIHENKMLLEEEDEEEEEEEEEDKKDEDEDEQDRDDVHLVELKVETPSVIATANIEDEYYVNDAEEKVGVAELRESLKEEETMKSKLYAELEKERQAAAIAAQETMAMITRLQEEKSAMQLEVEQFRRRVEDKAMYDQQAMDILKEILLKRETEKHALEKEVELYRERLLKSKAEEMKRSQLGNRSALPLKGSNASLEGHLSGNFDSEDDDDNDNSDNGHSWQRSGGTPIKENDDSIGSIGNIAPQKREGRSICSSAVVVGRTAIKENEDMLDLPDSSSINTGKEEAWLILERIGTLEEELRQFKEKTPMLTPTNMNPNLNPNPNLNLNPPRRSRMQVEGRAALQRNSRSFTNRISESDSDLDLSATSDFHPNPPRANKLKGNGTRAPHGNGIRGGSRYEASRHSRRFFPEWDENESPDERGSHAGDVDIQSQESSSGGRISGKDWHGQQENDSPFLEEDWHDFPLSDLRTKSMKMRDHKRMIREEEVQQLTGRLQALEADRENLKQALDSVKDQTMGLNLLEEISQQLREMQTQGRDPNSQENGPEKNLRPIFNNLVQAHGLLPKKSQDLNDREQ